VAARGGRAAGDFDSSPHWFSLTWCPRTTVVRGQLEAFHQGLKEYGWIEGQNISVEYRFAEGKEDALPGIAAELVRLRLDVIVAEGTAAIRAAKTVTQTIPIVMATSSDPVGTGLVASLNRPGGNVTGASLQTAELSGKRLQLLTEIVSGLAQVAVLSNPLNPSIAPIVEQTKAAAQSLGVELHVVEVQAPDKFESAFTAITSAHAGAFDCLAGPLALWSTPPHRDIRNRVPPAGAFSGERGRRDRRSDRLWPEYSR
jgi:putative ABC transport system substrate-binding protein